MARCLSCGSEGTLEEDTSLGCVCCTQCGAVRDEESAQLGWEHQVGMVVERGGVHVSDAGGAALASGRHWRRGGGAAPAETWHDHKRRMAIQRVHDVTSALRLGADRAIDVEQLVQRATGGCWGGGRWFGILVAAAAFAVARSNKLPLHILECAFAADCSVFELGRMMARVTVHADAAAGAAAGAGNLNLPPPEPMMFLERLVSSSPAFSGLPKQAVKRTLEQCRVLLEWAERWSITTGRHSSPVAAAAMLVALQASGQASEVQQVSVLDDICLGLHAQAVTAKKRHRELLEAMLAKVQQEVPWCRDLTLAKLPYRLRFVVGYLESCLKRSKKRKRDGGEQDRAGDEQGEEQQPEEQQDALLPKSFVASRERRRRRLAKVAAAKQRLRETKEKGAKGEAWLLDKEDVIIEHLLLHGVEAKQIEQGYYDALLAALQEDAEEVVSDEEIAKYIRGDEQLIELLRHVKFASDSVDVIEV